MTDIAANLVSREVFVNVSSIVSALGASYGAFEGLTFEARSLVEEAFELCEPREDYEEAAIQAGWSRDEDGTWSRDQQDGEYAPPCDSAQEACEFDDLEPHYWEIYEHWAVSDWLAEKLLERGERVGPFGNLTVWGRTTTGQDISIDSVIQDIAKSLTA